MLKYSEIKTLLNNSIWPILGGLYYKNFQKEISNYSKRNTKMELYNTLVRLNRVVSFRTK